MTLTKNNYKGSNPLIHDNEGDTIDALCSYSAHVAESLECDPEKRGLHISMQLICEALQNLQLDRESDQCHTEADKI
ncbi:hypothetical protein P0F40_002912 [Vibrio metschnikovii]|jgi:hypothetical protein|uniref:hypothetical protein n=1 Tax=Vibrio parahaemolyticus TaxID=670 RepID=UPI001D165AA0|nr:hypothetical protein [Vibrio parahaemolyticus]EKO3881145.1 hypothetical protein [Vibrio metschnikovii]ELP3316065.1 hypothetical protein [Vibrio fluvialis]EHK2887996.1 hypothetical protein [Vibrio parahaemolyticus]EII3108138.1 hypothetical protein [Vibrio parahaemolyticus]MCC3836229.1 hypothetical protein [Vibrio parahaemolyticus]